jgi:hypothetical protein
MMFRGIKSGCSGYRIRGKYIWDNLNSERREASRDFRNKKREYLKDKINDCATNSKNKNIKRLV